MVVTRVPPEAHKEHEATDHLRGSIPVPFCLTMVLEIPARFPGVDGFRTSDRTEWSRSRAQPGRRWLPRGRNVRPGLGDLFAVEKAFPSRRTRHSGLFRLLKEAQKKANERLGGSNCLPPQMEESLRTSGSVLFPYVEITCLLLNSGEP